MAKSRETQNKKEKEKLKLQKKKEKELRKEERKANAKEGKSFEDMIAYIDEYGNITSTPPDPNRKKAVINEADIELGSRNKGGATSGNELSGVVSFFNDSKGFGFIKGARRGESTFFHVSSANFPIKENDTVLYETQMGPKGLTAVNIRKG